MCFRLSPRNRTTQKRDPFTRTRVIPSQATNNAFRVLGRCDVPINTEIDELRYQREWNEEGWIGWGWDGMGWTSAKHIAGMGWTSAKHIAHLFSDAHSPERKFHDFGHIVLLMSASFGNHVRRMTLSISEQLAAFFMALPSRLFFGSFSEGETHNRGEILPTPENVDSLTSFDLTVGRC